MCFTSTGSNFKPLHMVWSPDQTLVMTNGDCSIAKVNIKDGSAVYKHKGLFLIALLTCELFFYCKLKKAGSYFFY